jgi:6-phosphogluconate dehydrogenase
MQLIAESYDLLKHAAGLSASQLQLVFAEWNRGELQSYLIEITSDIFGRIDEGTGDPLVERILDTAGQKGTGKWMSQNALDIGAPIPTINAAVEARILSALKGERVAASELLPGPEPVSASADSGFPDRVRQALYAAKICSYAQGMGMLRLASDEYHYDLRLGEIARIWKGGCIIRAALLDRIRRAYAEDPGLANLLISPEFRSEVTSRQAAWREVVCQAVTRGIACLAMADSLGYYDMYRRARLPANLLQAQRDYFGAHTYRRIDRDGVFHTEWGGPSGRLKSQQQALKVGLRRLHRKRAVHYR